MSLHELQVVRRLGCPLCRIIVANVLAEKSKFDALGVKIVLASAQVHLINKKARFFGFSELGFGVSALECGVEGFRRRY